MVPFPSHSRSLALKPSLSSHQMTTLFVQNDKAFTQMMIFFYPNRFLSQKKMLFDDFKDDFERENESERKREPEIPRLRVRTF